MRRQSEPVKTRHFKPSPGRALQATPVTGIAEKAINACSRCFSGEPSSRLPDFVTANAERLTLEAVSSTRRFNHPSARAPRRLVCHTCGYGRGASTNRPYLADVAGSTFVPVPAPLARRVGCVVHPSSRGGGLARTPQPCIARRDADRVVDLGVRGRPRRPCGLVGPGAGVPGVPHLVSRRRQLEGMDDRRYLPPEVTA